MTQGLSASLKSLYERVDALSLRERGMIFIGVMAVICIMALNLLLTPLRSENSRVEAALKAKNEQAQAVHLQLQALIGSSEKNQDTQRRDNVAVLEKELATLDQQLDQMTGGGLVSPQQMAKLLEQMLASSRGLELIKIESLPRALAVDEPAPGNAKVSGAIVYKHGVRIEVRGRYFDIINYLKALEALPWKVYWGQVALETEQYPTSKLTLVIYTLSRHTGWIGA
jgi:MSHA biogenesis protein MshJ